MNYNNNNYYISVALIAIAMLTVMTMIFKG